MVWRSRPIRTRLAVLSGGVALLAGGLTYLLPHLWAVAAVGVVAAGAGWLLAGRTLRPIRQIAATARRVDASHLHTRVGSPAREAEFAELAEALDAMLARLERACEAQRRFFADTVQAMKAPIAQQRALAQASGDPALLEVTERQEALVDELLTLTSSESAITAPVPVELADIAYRVSDGLEPEARRAGIELRVSAGPARTPGDPVLLERLAENLLQNAVRYNTADGWVRVATGTDGDRVHLTVANTGPVVPTGEVPALFEPFRRLTGCPDAAGLGLSIVRSVARAHGGQVDAAPRDGGGLVVQVTLPAQ